MFKKNSFLELEYICGEIELENNVENGEYTLSYKLTKIYDCYDECIMANGRGRIVDNKLQFSINNGLKSGLYTLLEINSEDGLINVKKVDNTNMLGAFMVMGNNTKNPRHIYKTIYNIREMKFNKIKEISIEENSIIFHVFVFCKNLFVSTCAQYDDVEIIPYDYLKYTSEVDYINSFFKKYTKIGLNINNEGFDTSTPSAVFFITNIKAISYEEAENYALEKVDVINNIFSLLLKSHGKYFATAVLNTKDNITKISMLESRYKGNLFLYAEQGFNVLHYYRFITNNNSYLKVYLKLLNDAINENDRMMKYYRYWNILEGIASHKQYENVDMKNWNGDIIKGKKGILKIGTEALNIVYELFREHLNMVKEEELINDLEKVTSVKMFLSICYQRRCCCAHLGECYINDTKLCNNKESMKNCKLNNIVHLENPIGFQDKILRKLEEFTSQILSKELTLQCGICERESKLIDSLIK